MAILSADKILNQTMYAKGLVNTYSIPSAKNPINKIPNGNLIGRVYSYVIGENGQLFWMFIDSNRFPEGTFYVLHNPNNLTVSNLDQILKDIEAEAEKEKLEQKGVLQYNIDKYIPYIIGVFAAAMLLPIFTNKKR